MNHEQIEELLAVRALGGLEGDDAVALDGALAEHGDCAECRQMEDEMAETAAMLASVLPPEPVSPGMVDAILAAVPPTLVAVPDAEDLTPQRISGTGNEGQGERRGHRTSWRTAVALAAAFALVMVGGALGLRVRGSVPVGSAAFAQQVVQFQGGKGTLTMVYEPGQAGAVLLGSGLPKPGKDQVYEIWTISGDQPASAGCATSQDGSLHTTVTANVGKAELMAVTIEASTCPDAPTSTPILTAPISA